MTVHVDRRIAWNGVKAKAYQARSQDGHVVLTGFTPGAHTVVVRPAS